MDDNNHAEVTVKFLSKEVFSRSRFFSAIFGEWKYWEDSWVTSDFACNYPQVWKSPPISIFLQSAASGMVAAREVAGAAGLIDTSSSVQGNVSRFLPYSGFVVNGTSCEIRNYDNSWSLITSSRWYLASASTRFRRLYVEHYKRGSTGIHSNRNLCDNARARTRCQPQCLSTDWNQHRLPRNYVQLELCKWYSAGNI